MAARPLVLPDTFDGDKNYEEWMYHFENVAAVNGWDEDAKLLWLKVRLAGKAQTTYQKFTDDVKRSYAESKKALKARFEPESRKERYRAEFQTRRRKKEENWADFADGLKVLVDKAYSDLEEKAREQLAVNHYLTNVDQQQVAFSVKQRCPKTLDEAVSATMEMESYLIGTAARPSVTGMVDDLSTHEGSLTSAVVGTMERSHSTGFKEILTRLEEIEKRVKGQEERKDAATRRQSVVCWNCGRTGHISRTCRQLRRGQ